MIVVNTTFRIAPWADALFAMDQAWWEKHAVEVGENFAGTRYSNNPLSDRFNFQRVGNGDFKTYGNSGASAIALAALAGAQTIILLGYDCQKTEGKSHWHGDHPPGLANVTGMNMWPSRFKQLANDWPGVRIINCSRATALTCFKRMRLHEALTT